MKAIVTTRSLHVVPAKPLRLVSRVEKPATVYSHQSTERTIELIAFVCVVFALFALCAMIALDVQDDEQNATLRKCRTQRVIRMPRAFRFTFKRKQS